MLNIRVFWDGQAGSLEYDFNYLVLNKKPVIPSVTFDVIIYDTTDKISRKRIGNTFYELTEEEKQALDKYAQETVHADPTVDSRYVRTSPQDLTELQQSTSRDNIGAPSKKYVDDTFININKSIEEKLDKTGGVVDGAFLFSQSEAIRSTDDNRNISICGGRGVYGSDGAFVELFGANHPTYKGAYRFNAGNAERHCEGWFYPDGRAVWNNKNFVFEDQLMDYLPLTGNRGSPAGKVTAEIETLTDAERQCTADDADTTVIRTSGAVTLDFVVARETTGAVKQIVLEATDTTVLSIKNAEWANKAPPPEWGSKGSLLIFCATFVLNKVILSIAHNGELL